MGHNPDAFLIHDATRNECCTPGAVYETGLTDTKIRLSVFLPIPLLDGLLLSEKQAIIDQFHAAILPVVEGIYRDRWKSRLAGKRLPKHDKPMPERWEDLDWLRFAGISESLTRAGVAHAPYPPKDIDATLIERLVLPMVQERSRESGDAWDQASTALERLLASGSAQSP